MALLHIPIMKADSADARSAVHVVRLDRDAWVAVWQAPPPLVPSRAFTRLWDARPREPTHILLSPRNQDTPASLAGMIPYTTTRLTRSYGVVPAFHGQRRTYMYAAEVPSETTAQSSAERGPTRACRVDAAAPADAPASVTPIPPMVEALIRGLAQECAAVEPVAEWTPDLTSAPWNQATVNWYRTGDDHMPRHSDWMHGAPPRAVVASLTLAPPLAPPREFVIQASTVKSAARARAEQLQGFDGAPATVSIATTNGTVVVMGGSVQERYVHGVPRVDGHTAPRINLSFRTFLA